MKKTVQFNKKITMHYSISNDKGLVFESTFNSSPITFKIGDGTIPQKLEMTLYGLKENDSQILNIEAKDAFGTRDDKKTKTINRSLFPNDEMIKINNIIEVDVKDKNANESTSIAIIKEINDDQIILDLNHPLAGIPIEFRVKIINIHE